MELTITDQARDWIIAKGGNAAIDLVAYST